MSSLDLSGLYEVLLEEKMEIIEVVEMLEVLRNGWLKYELGTDTLAKIAYMSGNPGELKENGLPKCVDDYLAVLIKALVAQLNRINELISQAEKGGGDGTSQSGC